MNRRTPQSRGVTIIEIVVVVGILTFLTGVIVTNHVGYNANTYFSRASEDIVLALRQAQVYGTAGKKNDVAFCGASNFECRYGVNFSMGTPDRFVVFVDNNDNKIYDAGADTLVETIMLKSPIAISSVECLPFVAGCVNNVLNVTFKRPSPDAIVNDTADMSGLNSGGYDLGRITVSNGIVGGGAKTSTITISKAGQISLQ